MLGRVFFRELTHTSGYLSLSNGDDKSNSVRSYENSLTLLLFYYSSIETVMRNIDSLRYADDTTLMAQSKEE